MKQRYNSLLLLVLIFLVGYNIFRTKDIQTDIKGYNQKIDSLQIGIDSVYKVNTKIDENILTLNKQIYAIDKDISLVENNIIKIKEKQNEKINSVNGFSFSELLGFFTNRYEIQIDSTGHNSSSKNTNR